MKKELGMLCHVTSIPSDYGVGDFGRSSREFIDFLTENGFNIWQILPLNQTNKYNCPYASTCYFSYDEMFVDPENLVSNNYIEARELSVLKKLKNSKKIKYEIVKAEKTRLLQLAYLKVDSKLKRKLINFAEDNPDILNYAYYRVLLEVFNTNNWREIDSKYWHKRNKAYKDFLSEHYDQILKHVFIQYILDSQWKEIRFYAKRKGIKILGDLPIYPDPNSFDVFNNPEAFKLNEENLEPIVYGGVPADQYSVSGQNWETCVYDWDLLKEKKYNYLINKIKNLLEKYDILRLDHFLGYTVHYEINVKDTSKGKWVKAGGEEFFNELGKHIDMSRIVIEDLGINKLEANHVKASLNLKGMSVLQMANWEKSSSKYLPDNVMNDSIYYLVTHDSNTFMGYLKDMSRHEKKQLCKVLNINAKNNKEILVQCIKKMISSPSQTIILQMQDLLFQGQKYRMNIPGEKENCWEYRVNHKHLSKASKTLNILKLSEDIDR